MSRDKIIVDEPAPGDRLAAVKEAFRLIDSMRERLTKLAGESAREIRRRAPSVRRDANLSALLHAVLDLHLLSRSEPLPDQVLQLEDHARSLSGVSAEDLAALQRWLFPESLFVATN